MYKLSEELEHILEPQPYEFRFIRSGDVPGTLVTTLNNSVFSAYDRKCGLHTTSTVITWEPVRSTSSRAPTRPTESDFIFSKGILFTLKSDMS